MPNIQSAKKRVRVTKAKTLQNQMFKSQLKTTIKKFETSLNEGKDVADVAYRNAVTKIDQAVSRGILHRNTAARKKSKLTLKLNKIA